MSERERDRGPAAPPPDEEPRDGDLARLRARGDDFLAAGDEAIERALSGDSEAFLRANRQEGGE
ncbi:MAG TPA: hypothetical protein VMT16_14360 [Thermoanaerobaculia bacterium]|nr:hypothetical protein [Thermoanaerobaculia bacterium]